MKMIVDGLPGEYYSIGLVFKSGSYLDVMWARVYPKCWWGLVISWSSAKRYAAFRLAPGVRIWEHTRA